MRLGVRRRICFRHPRHSLRGISAYLIILFLLFLFVASGLYFIKIVNPLLLMQAENQTRVLAEQAVQRAVNRLFLQAETEDFLTLSYMQDGSISVADAKVNQINQMKAQASLAIQKELDKLSETEISIPLGSVSGCSLFAGLGPYLPVKLMPYGRTNVNFESRFSSAGVNQTHLEINLLAHCYVNMVLPASRVATDMETKLPVVQTIIVGKVPDNYVNIDRMGEDFEGDVLDIIG
ncbi:MAG: sporulation protein YunB [Ruminococcaceae bacterium]|nr:sporulation protein YunB [Oscillospiraceae bacterium]